jgi:hypothetical protein
MPGDNNNGTDNGAADGSPGGFQVVPATLRKAGVAAIGIGQDVSVLAADIGPASSLPDGTQVASTMRAVTPLWEQHLTEVGGNVQNTGETLCAIAANYSDNESAIGESFRGIGV